MVSSRELIAAGHAVPGPHDAGVLGSGQALEIDMRLLAALSQGLREGRLSFTVLAGKPHCEAVTSKNLKISMTLILLYSSYP